MSRSRCRAIVRGRNDGGPSSRVNRIRTQPFLVGLSAFAQAAPRVSRRRRGAECLVALLAFGLTACRQEPRTSGALPHDAYVWQRTWTPSVSDAVRSHAGAFGMVSVLVGEVSWTSRPPQVVLAAPNITALQSVAPGTRIGLALRVGTFPGPFEADDAATRFLRRIARESLENAQKSGIAVAEFQIDFDCAERHLEGYRIWIEALRRELAPVPVLFTALPSWLNRSAFRTLAASSDGFVLQVHSLSRPRHLHESIALCDPAAAQHAVERAAKMAVGVPFRVALPTYGYRLAFSSHGTYLGASAEGPQPARPPDTQYLELSADPAAMAQLVATWTVDRPASMTGLIWYRLPVEDDRFNWRWRTLETVMAGQTPFARLQAILESPSPGLTEIRVVNQGSADRTGPVSLRLHWSGAQRLGADGIRGFDAILAGPSEVLFTNAICRLPAGDGSRIGWVRLNAPVPITLEAVVPSDLRTPGKP